MRVSPARYNLRARGSRSFNTVLSVRNTLMRIPVDKKATEWRLPLVVTNRSRLTATAVAAVALASLVVGAAAGAKEPQDVLVDALGSEYRLIGKLHAPLGEVVKVEGIVVEGPSKGVEGGPNLRVQRIQGQAIQEDIQIQLRPYWGEESQDPKLKTGATCRMEGFETGGYIGSPPKAYKNVGIEHQTAWYYFRTQLVVYKVEAIKPLRFTPGDFEGRRALMQGTARTQNHQSVMEGDRWSVIIDAQSPWPKHVEGKWIESYGLYKPDSRWQAREAAPKRFTLLNGTWRLVRLEDQVGQTVTLRGYDLSVAKDRCSFRYRGTDVYVANMTDEPRWPPGRHSYEAITVHGTLEKTDRGYLVKNASWEALPDSKLLAVERPEEAR
jgi:hypothetical protein